tara:strand:+ start:19 stop:1302 length:1284 start_codon:yes stop_codon:yes gene_type:complete
MGKKYTTDTLSATQGVYGKQLYTDTGETVANIVSYTENVGSVITNVDYLRYQSGYSSGGFLQMQTPPGQLPTFSVGNTLTVYNQDNSEVIVSWSEVNQFPGFVYGDVNVISGTPSGSYQNKFSLDSFVTNIVTDTYIPGILNPNDYVYLGINSYLVSTVGSYSIEIAGNVSNIANIASIQNPLGFKFLNYRSVLTDGSVLTSPMPISFDPITLTSNLLGIKLSTNSSLNNFFVGEGAGSGTSVTNSVFIGNNAGQNCTNSNDSLFVGSHSGYNSGYGDRCSFIGGYSGYLSSFSYGSFFAGYNSGRNSSSCSSSVFIGQFAGGYASNASNSIIIGYNAGYQSSGQNVTALGRSAARDNDGDNVVAIGPEAAYGNTLSGKTIFSNQILPSYTNRTSATTAITVANGASAGDTYLYYNASNFQIEGVRL